MRKACRRSKPLRRRLRKGSPAALDALQLAADERARIGALGPQEQIVALGREVARAKNCAACHEIKPAGEEHPWKPVTSRHDFLAIAGRDSAGCLAAAADTSATNQSPTDRSASGAAPRFTSALDREAVRAFSHGRRESAGPPCPGRCGSSGARAIQLPRLSRARRPLAGCRASTINRLGRGEQGVAELVTPPSLTDVTAKLTSEALHGVLEGNERARPWMSLEMPRLRQAERRRVAPCNWHRSRRIR